MQTETCFAGLEITSILAPEYHSTGLPRFLCTLPYTWLGHWFAGRGGHSPHTNKVLPKRFPLIIAPLDIHKTPLPEGTNRGRANFGRQGMSIR